MAWHLSWVRLTAAAALLAPALLAPALAAAETRNFVAPSLHGLRLDWCAHLGSDCGKPAADLFCRENGFTGATAFAIEQGLGARGVKTLVFGDGRTCEGPNCAGFRSITCTKPDRASPPAVLRVQPIAPQTPLSLPQTGAGSPGVKATPPVAVKPDSGKPPTTPVQAGKPIFVLPGGALLFRPGGDFKLTTDLTIAAGSASQSYDFSAEVASVPNAEAFRWQVTTKPFPPFAGGTDTDLSPPTMLAWGNQAGKAGSFSLDFAKIAAKAGRGPPPGSFYVRVVPLAGMKSEIVVGQPSNVIRVYYTDKPPQQAPIVIESTAPPNLFAVKLLSFTPPGFDNPNRWGCVVITGYTEPILPIIKSAWPLGEKCPKSFKGGSGQITSFGGFVDWATGGLTDAWDWLSEGYDKLKKVAVDIVMDYTPFGVQCNAVASALGKDGSDYCRAAAEIGVNAGMAALGLPPSIPNYNQLVDQGVDAAVDIAAEQITQSTPIPCVGPCRDALKKGFSATADQLKKSSYVPGCVGEAEAHEHGREPLCLPDGVIAKPAPGAVYQPPVAILSVTRLVGQKDPKSQFKGGCGASVDVHFKNVFQGTTVWGPFNNTKKVPTQAIAGNLFFATGVALAENMPQGTTKLMPAVFKAPTKFIFPWTKELWMKSQIPARDESGPMGPDWFALYSGSTATVAVGVTCGTGTGKVVATMPKLF